MTLKKHPDSDAGKGAVENERAGEDTNTSLRGQLGHRTDDPDIKDNDSDFPEPGGNPEHTGEPDEPGYKQKLTHNKKREDPLAS